MNNSQYSSDVADLFQQLQARVGHDAQASEILTNLHDHLKRNIDTLAIERRVADQVAGVYEFDAAEPSNIKAPENFLTFFENARAHVGFAMAMARDAEVSKDDIEYLNAKVQDALGGAYDIKALSLTVPTQAEVKRVIDEAYTPLIDMTQRIMSIETPANFFNDAQIEHLIRVKTDLRERAEGFIAGYDPAAEDAFQAGIQAKLAIETGRLASFKRDGTKDPAVVVSPLFEFYEDQILLNIQVIKGEQEAGSQERRIYERALADREAAVTEIAQMEALLASSPARQKVSEFREKANDTSRVIVPTSAPVRDWKPGEIGFLTTGYPTTD
jgi:hypothetical protein